MSEVIRSERGQAVLISLQNDPGDSRGQNAPVERFEWRRPLRQRNGKNGWRERNPSLPVVWGLSSAGRASALQAEGHRFDPDRLHQMKVATEVARFAGLRIGCRAFLGLAPSAHASKGSTGAFCRAGAGTACGSVAQVVRAHA